MTKVSNVKSRKLSVTLVPNALILPEALSQKNVPISNFKNTIKPLIHIKESRATRNEANWQFPELNSYTKKYPMSTTPNFHITSRAGFTL